MAMKDLEASNIKLNVPLEEALNIAGFGTYSIILTLMTGVVDFAAFAGIQVNSMVIPAASCDLQLTTYQKGALNSMTYTGMLFSSHLWGFLSDAYGRRTVLLLCSAAEVIILLLTSLSPDATTLMIATFISGLMLSGLFTTIYVYISECIPASSRSLTMVLVCAMSSLANLYLPSVAWPILPLDISIPMPFLGINFTSWRLFIALISVPFLASTIFLYILPETPKFLLDKGRQEDTLAVLRKAYAVNQKKDASEFPVGSVVLDKGDMMEDKNNKGSNNLVVFCKTIFSQTAMIFSPPLLKYTLLSCALCMCHLGAFNMFILWFPEVVNRLVNYSSLADTDYITICDVMSGDVTVSDPDDDPCVIKDLLYIITISNGALQVFSYYIYAYISGRVDKKKLLTWTTAIATVACGVVIFANQIYLLVASMILVILATLVIFPVYISIVVGYFPTALRTNATSIVMLAGRIASVGGSQLIGYLFEANCGLAYPVATALLAGMTVLIFSLPMSRKV